jgi:hypothetical protein
LEKLEQFRSFYLWVVGYVYFTRIVVYFLAATVSYLLVSSRRCTRRDARIHVHSHAHLASHSTIQYLTAS